MRSEKNPVTENPGLKITSSVTRIGYGTRSGYHNDRPSEEAYSWDIRSAEARMLQAGALPNPELEIEVEEFGGSGETEGFDAATTSVILSQVIDDTMCMCILARQD